MRRSGGLALAVVLVLGGCGRDLRSGGAGEGEGGEGGSPRSALPAPSAEPVQAPEEFKVLFETSAGNFTILVERRLAPHGADRFYELVSQGFYDDQRFFRVVPGFVVQWGLSGNPEVTARWAEARIPDDPVVGSNVRGTIAFAATREPGSRTTQVFINLADNTSLDGMGFAPFGRVIEGMEAVEAINAEYREAPNQAEIRRRGNEYLNREFPRLDYIKKASIIP